jgi:hypothetical protein
LSQGTLVAIDVLDVVAITAAILPGARFHNIRGRSVSPMDTYGIRAVFGNGKLHVRETGFKFAAQVDDCEFAAMG